MTVLDVPGAPEVPGYEVRGLLGRGAGGDVWLASERASGEAVAVKCVRPGADLAVRDRLRREAAVLAGIDHPHVLRLRAVVGCVGAGDELALVLDLATGGSLARLVARRGRLSAGEVVTVLVPLAEALAGVHARGVVHGDVTPSNVLFAADGRPVLADLGVARLVGGPDPGVDAGTPGFRDPQAGWGVGPAADVHGLAATCFLALTGEAPYDGGGLRPARAGHGTLLELLQEVLTAPPDGRPDALELARRAFGCCPAVPVRLDQQPVVDVVAEGAPDDGYAPLTVVSARRRPPPPPGTGEPAGAAGTVGPRRHRRSPRSWRRKMPWRRKLPRRWRPAGAVLLGAVAVATAAVTGIAWAGSGSGPLPVRGLTSPAEVRVAGGAEREVGAGSDAGQPRRDAGQPGRDVGQPGRDAGQPGRAAGPPMKDAAQPRGQGGKGRSGWSAVLASLDAERSAAFATADAGRLARVYTVGSPAGRRDRRQLAGLAGAGLRAEGMRLRILRVTEVHRSERHVRLQVVDVLRPHRLVDRSGAVVERRPGRTARRWSVTLALDEGRWRVYDVTRE